MKTSGCGGFGLNVQNPNESEKQSNFFKVSRLGAVSHFSNHNRHVPPLTHPSNTQQGREPRLSVYMGIPAPPMTTVLCFLLKLGSNCVDVFGGSQRLIYSRRSEVCAIVNVLSVYTLAVPALAVPAFIALVSTGFGSTRFHSTGFGIWLWHLALAVLGFAVLAFIVLVSNPWQVIPFPFCYT